MPNPIRTITVEYDAVRLTGKFYQDADTTASSSIWERIKARAVAEPFASIAATIIEMPWASVLEIIREFGTRYYQQTLEFKFTPVGEAIAKIREFVEEVKLVRSAHDSIKIVLTREEILQRLQLAGFSKRSLKVFQLRDLERLVSLPHGANFSVPGAGKTTVTLALHLLIKQQNQHLFVVAPKAAFPAWRGIVEECMASNAPANNAEGFTLLDGSSIDTGRLLASGATRFLMSYDLMIRQQTTLAHYFARQSVHLILDEAHRMKAGVETQRGAFLLSIARLPTRRDILTGTPMPQDARDIASQLQFLLPSHGLNLRIDRGEAPRTVLGNLYVRTTKQELGLPPVKRHYHQVGMAPGQLALYGVVRNEVLRQLARTAKGGSSIDYLKARKSVMRLLQLSSNPILALKGIAGETVGLDSGIVDEVISEGSSLKMQAVANHARRLAQEGQKTVIWTIFTDTINELNRMLADINPVMIYGAVVTGEASEADTREGRLHRFHEDAACQVLIANPAAAGEGISLHTVCHNAIYLDRSYVSTHYLQSIDRIHRLGLPKDIETNIHIYQTKAPSGLGSIDYSVSRRLAQKIRNLQQLLDDPDLHQVALDEENADDPVDYDVEIEDMIDLIEELEGRSKISNEE